MIDLSDEGLILGSGRSKTCFLHPHNTQKCIKVVTGKDANQHELKKELREFKRQNRVRGGGPLIIPHYYGTVNTSLGKGYLYQRVLGEHGEKLPTLRQFILSSNLCSPDVEEILTLLYSQFYERAVIISELNPDNIMVNYRNSLERSTYALVDGLGEGAFLKFTEWHPFFARKKLQRKFSTFRGAVRALTIAN